MRRLEPAPGLAVALGAALVAARQPGEKLRELRLVELALARASAGEHRRREHRACEGARSCTEPRAHLIHSLPATARGTSVPGPSAARGAPHSRGRRPAPIP